MASKAPKKGASKKAEQEHQHHNQHHNQQHQQAAAEGAEPQLTNEQQPAGKGEHAAVHGKGGFNPASLLPTPDKYVDEYSDEEHGESVLGRALVYLVLGTLYVLAFVTRMFSVIRYESVIHEFDPYFNYRTTQRLTEHGWYDFYNWFDDTVWYPLGRHVGFTVYPGLMATAGVIYFVLHALHFTIEIRNVCVFLGSFFAGNTSLATYFFTKQIHGKGAGLVAATLVAVVPGYTSRSVAGSYDNEAVAIFAIVFTFYTWLKALNTGSLKWCMMCVLAYFYMVNAWGGYIFIINLIPLHVVLLVAARRYTHRLYVAYSFFYLCGSLLAMQVNFVGFKAIRTPEHFAALAVFIVLQGYAFILWVRGHLSAGSFRAFIRYFAVGVVAFLAVGYLFGIVQPFSGRFYTLLTGGKAEIPIIASVSEHQPTPWGSLFFDLNIALALAPAGLFFCFRDLSDASLFLVLFGVSSCYFAGIMVRLVLVFAPAACALAGIALSESYRCFFARLSSSLVPKAKDAKTPALFRLLDLVTSVSVLVVILISSVLYVTSSVWVTSEAYSSPSIVLMTTGYGGQRHVIDDFREAYRWMAYNTDPSAKFLAWWDYGYQMNAMANRTTIADNNTWNNTHIATVGRVLASNEEEAYKVLKRLDVDYVLVIFGGRIGYSSDDINKFLWPVRISANVYPQHVNEKDYYAADGSYRVDKYASKTMFNSMMYKMCYYRFGELVTQYGKPPGFDRTRGAEIGKKGFKLSRIEEAFTSQNWLVRIYRVKPEPNRAGGP